jgi:hypothetical protein
MIFENIIGVILGVLSIMMVFDNYILADRVNNPRLSLSALRKDTSCQKAG